MNYFNTLLNGNRQAATAALQPNIDQIREQNAAQLNAASKLLPRGGGRSSSLFNLTTAPQSQIQNLYNPLRGQAAAALPQIGLNETQQGGNFFGLGNQALSAATGANVPLAQSGLQTQQFNQNVLSGLGQGIFGLLTSPLTGGAGGGGKSLLGLLQSTGAAGIP